MRGSPRGLDPPHLRRRLRLRGLRRREPAVLSAANELQALLGLEDDELLAILDVAPLEVISGELEHRPEIGILLDLLADARERASDAVLRRWVRTPGRRGVPLGHLLNRDFAEFEEALAELAEHGFVIRRSREDQA